MKVLILGAGYGTRLQRDILKDPQYHHLKDVAKPLLPIAGRPLINHWIQHFDPLQVRLVCNQYNHHQFIKWASEYGFDTGYIFNDGTTSNENRLGTVQDIAKAIRFFGMEHESILIIAGDLLFYDMNDLKRFLNVCVPFGTVNEHSSQASPCKQVGENKLKKDKLKQPAWMLHYPCEEANLSKTGILELDGTRVVNFLEKPLPSQTNSRCAAPCFYYFPPDMIELLEEFLVLNQDWPMTEWDAAGKFIAWAIHETEFNSMEMSGRFDLGDLACYIEAERYFTMGFF